jgi:hypothetical protein
MTANTNSAAGKKSLCQNLILYALLCLQDQGNCAACLGFASTAAAEAAINVNRQQNWDKLGLSEQDISFCRLAAKHANPEGNCLILIFAKSSESFCHLVPRAHLNEQIA